MRVDKSILGEVVFFTSCSGLGVVDSMLGFLRACARFVVVRGFWL